MPSINSATIQKVTSANKEILGPAAIFAAGAATNEAVGFNPATSFVDISLGNPMSSASTLFITNPFQSLQATKGRASLSGMGFFGYKTLISGVGPGGWTRNLTAGNLVLSTIQGGARTLNDLFGGIGQGNVATAFRHARTVGLAGLINPNKVVHELTDYVATSNLGETGIGKLSAVMDANRGPSRTMSRHLRHFAGAGEVTAEALKNPAVSSAVKLESIGATTTRAIVPRLDPSVKPLGFSLGVYKKGRTMHNIGVAATRGVFRVGSMLAYFELGTLIGGMATNASVRGVSNLAISALEILRSVNSRDITPAQMQSIFMTAESATERQRAVSAIYGAKVNPSNRFLGNEAKMYHA